MKKHQPQNRRPLKNSSTDNFTFVTNFYVGLGQKTRMMLIVGEISATGGRDPYPYENVLDPLKLK